MKVKFADKIYEVLYIKEVAGKTLYAVEDEPNHIDWLVNIEVIDEESKDERIRKELIKFLRNLFNNYSYFIKDPFYTECIAWLEKQGEQKPVDKVEPKFKIGDWIIQENIGVYKVIEICKSWYEVINTEDKHYSISFDKEYMCHLWSIEDAKDGDILACENGWTCIFKTLVNEETFGSYCFMDSTEWFCGLGSECHTLKEEFVKAYNGKIQPAKKEQRDLFFKKMQESGYEWNEEKKELKNLKNKTNQFGVNLMN